MEDAAPNVPKGVDWEGAGAAALVAGLSKEKPGAEVVAGVGWVV